MRETATSEASTIPGLAPGSLFAVMGSNSRAGREDTACRSHLAGIPVNLLEPPASSAIPALPVQSV